MQGGIDMAEFLNHSFSVFFVALFIVSVVVFIVLTFQRFHEWLNYINTPQETHIAKIVLRSLDTVYRGTTGGVSFGSDVVPVVAYEVVFELENKEQMHFYVSLKEYEQWHEGDSGKLTFKKDKYISFVKESKCDVS